MLPSACRLNEAIANDKEYADYLASLPQSDTEWAPRVSEFDLGAHISREILHTLKSIKQVLVATGGGSPSEEKPFPGPRTEIERAIADADRQWAESFVAQFGFSADDI